MEQKTNYPSQSVPARAYVLSLAALAIPVTGALAVPEILGEHGALLWLLMLLPAFLLAYYRGWRGVATALAFGMAALSITQVFANLLELQIPVTLFAVVLAYLGIALGIGWVTERLHRDRAEVEGLALTDILTRLPNRRHARVFLENEFAAAARGRSLAVVLFDLDHFKEYNDQFGHAAGDEALQSFGDIMARTTRRMNLSARFGGEEFLTVLAGSDADGAIAFAERIRATLRRERLSPGSLTVSAGVAAYHPSMVSPDELLAAADHALYRAKREGRNCVRLFGRTPLGQVLPGEEELNAARRGTGMGFEGDDLELFDRGASGTGAPHAGGRAKGAGSEASPGSATGATGADDPDGPDGPDAAEIADYPRNPDDIGRTRPSLSLLPHQITHFGDDRKLLLVEDEESVRGLLRTYLSREGFQVTEALDVDSAIAQLTEEFEVVITDIRLPGASGNELVAAVKSRWPTTQVIVITGFRDAQIAAEALNAGADGYLFKPFGMPELRSHIVDALSRRDRVLSERSERHLLTNEARERADQAREAVLKGALALVRAVEVRDPYTRGHSARVAAYAVTLAIELEKEGHFVDLDSLRLACQLHDVGKIGIPDAILNKVSSLSGEEFIEVEDHPRTGRRILEPLLDDEVVLAVTSWHHERWDGGGYPDGLTGTAIPFAARVVGLVDALDAMTSDRAYRKGRSWDVAIGRIREGAGTQFDPGLLSAFEAVLPQLHKLFLEAIEKSEFPV